ncbi:hypothetical protein SUGI_0481680 [Cryptomeria japonica]|nr:hypothetical protein SUGI_0481680 [Cryptomeria japonica]
MSVSYKAFEKNYEEREYVLSPSTATNYESGRVAMFDMLPLDSITDNNTVNRRKAIDRDSRNRKKKHGLKVQAVMSFHQCGGNVGDSVTTVGKAKITVYFTGCDELTLCRFHKKLQGELPGHYGETIVESLTTLGFFKDLGGNVGILSGLINEVTPPWVVLGIGAIMNITGALVTCVKNFPQSRGSVLGIFKGFVGLSGAIFTQIYHAIYGQDNTGVILLLEIYNIKLQRLTSQSRNGSLKPVHIDVKEDGVKIKDEKKPKTEINLANFISESVASQEVKGSEQPKSLRSRLVKMFKSPTRGEEYTIPEALVSVDMIILFAATTCGVGTTFTAIDNMGKIGKALGYTPVMNISTFVSLISILNFLALVTAGFLSEFVMQKYKVPRPLMFTIELLIACVEHVFTSFALPGSPYVASIVIGLSFGAQWLKSLRSCLDASPLARNVAKRRLFVVFICFLIMSPAEGTFMRDIYPKPQSAQTISDSDINQYVLAVHSGRGASEIVAHSGHTAVDISNVEKYDEVEDGKHDSTQGTAATMEVCTS